MNRPFLTMIAALLVCAPAAGTVRAQGDLPAMGDSSTRIMSPDQETGLGRQIIRQMRAEGWISGDPELTEYLQSLGQRLVSHSGSTGQRFNFYLVGSEEVNAFALPGGYIGINAGLIMMSQNESELAGVVAHEVAHVTQRHIARGFEQAARTGMVTTLGVLAAVLAGAASGQPALAEAGVAAGIAAQIQDRINYTRMHEYEADRIGIRTMGAAGFDPEGMVTMFEQMGRRARLAGVRIPEFLSTHPVSTSRISEARSRAAEHGRVESHDSRAYRLMRTRARVLVTTPTQALEYFTATLRNASAEERAALEYGQALALTGLGRHDEARALLAPLLDAQDDVFYFHLALAKIDYAAGDLDTALRRYERAMRMFPGNEAVTLAYAEALLHAGEGRRAIPLLVSLLPQREPDPHIYRLLARASGASGETADAHYFMSEVHVLNGQVLPAVDQLQLALATPGINVQQRARAEARLEQLSEYLPRGRRVRLDQPLPPPPEQDTGR